MLVEPKTITGILERFTYKPDVTIHVAVPLDADLRSVTIYLTAAVQDSTNLYGGTVGVTIHNTFPIPSFPAGDQDAIMEWCRFIMDSMVWEFERHEMDEWLKFDGVCVKNPHNE